MSSLSPVAVDFQLLFEAAPGMYLVLLPDLTIVAVSEAYLRATMTQRVSILGRGLFEVFPDNPDDTSATGVDNLRASLGRVLAGRVADTMAVQRYDIRRPESEGGGFEERFWSPINTPVLSADGQVQYIIHRVEDVTEFVRLRQQRTELGKITDELRTHAAQMETEVMLRAQQVQEANKQLRGLNEELSHKERDLAQFFTLSLDMLCIAGPDGRFKRLNPAFETLGYTLEELTARPFLDFVHPDDRERTVAEVGKLAEGRRTLRFENRYRCKDGSYRNLVWSSTPDDTGHLYATARDVTEQKEAEEELARLANLLSSQNEELVAANRAKSDFLAMMSHELRTPLNAIIGFSEILIDQRFGPLNDRQSRYLGNVYEGGKHLLVLINDLLDLSKIEAGRLEIVAQVCSPRALTEEAMATLQPLADAKSIALGMDVGDDSIPSIFVDPVRAKQVLYNLLSNGIKFTPSGGRVAVGFAQQPSGQLRITVSDSGPGITEADLTRLFQSFSQLDNAKDSPRSGTGLGLALTKQLVELMGGGVGVRSTVGVGSCFYVDLPTDPYERGRAEAEGPAAHGKGPLALVVDDDPGARELVTLTLQGAGYRVFASPSGEAALAQARAHHPDLITLDVLLPGIDGWDVLRALQGDPETRGIPVVLVTISEDRGKAFGLGAIGHLVKPLDRQSLLGALERRSFTTQVQARPIHVLAVDDDPQHLELVRAALEPRGFRVSTATSGRRGIEIAMGEPVDLLLLDLILPDLSGIEVVAALRREPRTRELPILLVTAHDLSVQDRMRLKGDVEGVLGKSSLVISELTGEIDRVVGKGGRP